MPTHAPAPAARVNPSTKLYLRMERAQLDAVSFILETTPGDMRVYFYFTDDQKTFLAPGSLWVGADFDREGLEALLGKGSVVLDGSGRWNVRHPLGTASKSGPETLRATELPEGCS